MNKRLIFIIITLSILISCVNNDEIGEEIISDENEDIVVGKKIEILNSENNKSENKVQEEPINVIPGLVAYFPFDDNANDQIKNYIGELKGGAGFKKGVIGNALYLDGVDGFVSFSDNAIDSLGTLKKGSIAFWINFESILNEQAIMPIFYMGIMDNSQKKDNMFIIEIGHAFGTDDFSENGFTTGKPDPENKKIYATWIKDGNKPFLCSDSEVNIVENKWQHFAVVSGEDGNKLFLNGDEIKNRDYNFGHSSDKAFLNDILVKEIMTIGYGRSHNWISPEFVYYKGLIDDLRIYEIPLKEKDVKVLFEMGN